MIETTLEATKTSIWTLNNVKVASEIFQSLAIGTGAILAGIGGLIVFLDWKDKRRKEDKLKNLRKRYPRELLNKDFVVGHTNKQKGWLFILDYNSKKRHWIRDPHALRSLGYSGTDAKLVGEKKFKSFKESEEISFDI